MKIIEDKNDFIIKRTIERVSETIDSNRVKQINTIHLEKCLQQLLTLQEINNKFKQIKERGLTTNG